MILSVQTIDFTLQYLIFYIGYITNCFLNSNYLYLYLPFGIFYFDDDDCHLIFLYIFVITWFITYLLP